MTLVDPDTDPKCLAAELGITDMDLLAKTRRLLTVHKIINNTADPLTARLMSLQLQPDDPSSTELARSQSILSDLTASTTLSTFLATPYIAAKLHLRDRTDRIMQLKWDYLRQGGNSNQRHLGKLKPKWGLDPAMAKMPTILLAPLLHFRTSMTSCPSANGLCSLCNTLVPDYHHLLFSCPHTAPSTHIFIGSLLQHLPNIHTQLTDLLLHDHDAAPTYILGSVQSSLSPRS